MLLTVTPNLCQERTVQIDGFAAGKVHRVQPDALHLNAGGKGINAARIASELGCETLATSWVGRQQLGWFEAQLQREGIAHELVVVETDTRVTLNIIDGAGSGKPACKTEVVEAGNPVFAQDLARMTEKVAALLPGVSLLAICGSYPPQPNGNGHETARFNNHLASLVKLARQKGVRTLVDGKGKPFELLLESDCLPWCIKPNVDEAAALLGRSIDGKDQEIQAVRGLLALGIEIVILSCGARGAYLGTGEKLWFFKAPLVTEISPVGSGDSLVGAFAAQFLHAGDLLEALRWGVAAGAANAAQLLPAFCKRHEIARLVQQVDAVDLT